MKSMKVGITIDGVLRDIFEKIEDTHSKYFPKEKDEKEIVVLDYDYDKWVIFPEEEVENQEIEFNPNFNEDNDDTEQTLIKKVKKVTLEEFLFEKCTLEIFGSANESQPNIMKKLNDLILEYPQHEFIIISREIGLSIPATLFFLAKTSCMGQNIKFVKEFASCWEHADMIVTDHPKILESKPKDKISVKVKKQFNEDIESDYSIESLKNLDDCLQF